MVSLPSAESGTMDRISDDDDEEPSSGSETYEEGDLMTAAMDDDVTAQLAAAGWQIKHANGPVGVAAAAAIVSAKKRKRPHSFETNPSIRKRQQNRLLRKLRQTIDEFATRVGQQAVVLVATPGKPNSSYKVFGAKPLEDVVKNLRNVIMEELESALAQQAPPPVQDDPSLYELPPLIIDGIPTPVEKMTQAQLRAFIPLMLKYSTGRGKPGWGRDSTRPPWWPKELPWANVRMDARSEDEKQKISWTHALRQIVINCYKFHGREDLLPAFSEEDDKSNVLIQQSTPHSSSHPSHSSSQGQGGQSQQQQQTMTAQYPTAVLQTITNPDGTVSIIQVDPSNPIITLPDGTTAQVQGVATIHTSQGEVQALAEVAGSAEGTSVAVDLNSVTEATLGQDGQIILTGEDGHGYPVSVSGVITVPVSASMYQTMVANIQSDGTMQVVTPMVQVPKVEPGNGETSIEAVTIQGHPMTMINAAGEHQVLQVISLKDANVLTKAMQAEVVKDEDSQQQQTVSSPE
ncbi:DNA-binding protein P3A2 isoform X1 [Apis laboriosa]|uniref:DNA-binding protein P3A2 isoform X3 n=1 Tax=Apis mellifera TaxID=7460 RepID=A0A7M7L225_APIME|nr:DNA-binding protein P3A2 isoform X1 [Apis dorsata]XP_012346110.1 DNA-binding protein P3A2 isoform X3 [Apis florea]XP_016906683.1 DNA-binding protein P3A2 isoform X3 [Apis cerana]XP_026296573.1 DNA-binding protein P3A2 isoform X3 [Apis mellifera]XP_031365384.1 DNA-binding protein P3A2 isoform X1 [Apis dorsata]XP_031365385.1 DNA-binding protein P3A2 isoform X1 [Apis dorsata]XP_043793294.1 DNA-binding protein P3A2 isoform X1 [Apis laboriosa]XP_043793295.1 DNA-binding protein P3A2 isoform X1 |eukprot:XP_026296573.1 DNA-binding protein P3A2 isoform X3 [Apis mellifera]